MKKEEFNLKIPSDPKYLKDVDKLSTRVSKAAHLSESESDDIGIAVTELVNNAIHHGNKNDKNKNVSIKFELSENELIIRIKDEGNGFDPDKLGDPLAPENIMKLSGRGIFLIKTLLDDIKFNFTKDGTEVKVTKKIKS